MPEELSTEVQAAILKEIVAWTSELKKSLLSEFAGDGERTENERLWELAGSIQVWSYRIQFRVAEEWMKVGLTCAAFAAVGQRITDALVRMAMSELRDAYFSFFTDGCIPSDKPVCIPEAVAREYEEHFRVAIGREWPFLIEQYRCRVLLFTEEGDVSPSPGEGADCAAVQDSRPCFYSRVSWLKNCLLERGWSTSDPYAHGGPDRKTVEKVLRGESVRNDVLEKLAAALSQKCGQVSVLDIPQR